MIFKITDKGRFEEYFAKPTWLLSSRMWIAKTEECLNPRLGRANGNVLINPKRLQMKEANLFAKVFFCWVIPLLKLRFALRTFRGHGLWYWPHG